MYVKFEEEKQAFLDAVYSVSKLPALDFKYMDSFLKESFAAKAVLKERLGLGEDFRKEIRIDASNVVAESVFYRIFQRYIQRLHADAAAHRHGLTAKHLEMIKPLVSHDGKNRSLQQMVSANLVTVQSRDLKLSRYLTQFCTNETFQSHLLQDKEREKLNGKYQTYETFISALFEHAGNAKRAMIISANPLDIMLASEKFGTTRSCHSLDGEWANGNICYSLSDLTAIVMLRQEEPKAYPYQKVGRMFLYLDKESNYKRFVLGKAYGNVESSQITEIATIITETLANEPWAILLNANVPNNRVGGPRGFGGEGARPLFFDQKTSAFAAAISTSSKEEIMSGATDVMPFFLFPGAKCLECGCKWYEGRNLSCNSCAARSPACASCRQYVRPGTKGVENYKDKLYCRKCYEQMFFNCAGCAGHFDAGIRRNIVAGSRGEARNGAAGVCPDCYAKAFTCPCCKLVLLPSEANTVGGTRGNVCGQCLDEKYKICNTCKTPSVRVIPQFKNGAIVALNCQPCSAKAATTQPQEQGAIA